MPGSRTALSKLSREKGQTESRDLHRTLNEAVAQHQKGNQERAEFLYHSVLEHAPHQPDALHLLGLLAHQQGRHDRCVELIGKALEFSPGNTVFLFNLAVALAEMKRKFEAVSTYRTILDQDPAHVQALFNLGNLYRDMDNPEEAESCYREALRLKPDYVKAQLNLGTLLQTVGRFDEALSEFQKARNQHPKSAGPHFRLGSFYRTQGRFQEAVSAYKEALRYDPDFAKAYNNIGNIHQDLGEIEEAKGSYRRALEIQPDYTIARFNMANLLQLDGDIDRAIAEYRRVLKESPEHIEAHINLGHALKRKGRIEEAIAEFKKVREVSPENGQVLAALVHQLQYACDWNEIKKLQPLLDAYTDQSIREGLMPPESPFENLTRHDDPERNLAVARLHSAHIELTAERMKEGASFSHSKKNEADPLTVGYVSHDFCGHPVAHLIQGLFGAHDRDRFRVHAYSFGPDDGSIYRERIQKDADRFVDLRKLSHLEAARTIHADGVDILVDLMGHTLNSRMEIFGLRPAPVQLAFLGYPGTTGAAFMDYFIADRTVAPPEHAVFFTENLVYLPHTYQVNDGRQPIDQNIPDPKTTGLPENRFVFCSFNQSYKIEPIVFDRWMSILRRVPDSILWLLQGNASAVRNLQREAEVRGVDAKRLVFAGRLEKSAHLARQKLADLALDTFLVNGHTTTSDILWSGVPVIACLGRHFASRVAASLLKAVGLPELAAPDPEAYEELAVRLANQPEELAAIRKKLAHGRIAEPLFDTVRFVRHLERAYEAVWDRRRREAPLRALEIPDSENSQDEYNILELTPAPAVHPSGAGSQTAGLAADRLKRAQKLLLDARTRQQAGDAQTALKLYEEVLALHPGSIAALGNMGAVYHSIGRLEEAEARYRMVLDIKPDSHEAYNNLGNVFESRGETEEAIRCYKKAVEIAAEFAEGYNNLGLAYKNSGKNDKAMEAYEKAIAVNPEMDRAYNGLIYLYQQFCMWDKVAAIETALDRLTENAVSDSRKPAESPFTNLTRSSNLKQNLRVARSWSKDIARRMKEVGRPFDFSALQRAKEKLTIGYLSNDFYNHATAHLMLGLFSRHNRNRFRIHCYSYGKKDTSIYSRRIREDCDLFHDISSLSHEDAAKTIYRDGVDILVELKGYTKDNRLEITALRPAPIQIEWLGFPCTTGADFIDYVVTDRIITPEEHLPFYSEKPIYLPHTYQVNDDRQTIAERAFSRADFDLPEGAFVFCSFNQAYKFTPEVFEIWMRLLRKVPGSVLWLIPRSKLAETRLREEAEKRGIDKNRIICSTPMPKDAHLARHRLADLGLDTYIVNGHTTTSDALWAGLPVVSLIGPHFASRVSASLLQAVGLPELVAEDLAGYEKVALRLARHPAELSSVRARLLDNRGSYPLFDTERFASNLEQAFEAAWHRFMKNLPPDIINIADEAGPRAFDSLPLPDIQEISLVPGELSPLTAALPVVAPIQPLPRGADRPAPRTMEGYPLSPVVEGKPGPVSPDPETDEPLKPALSHQVSDPMSRGRTCFQSSRFEEAAEWFEKAAHEAAAKAAEAYNEMANAWLSAAKPEQAVSSARKALNLQPLDSKPFQVIAVAFHRMGNSLESRNAFERAVELNPRIRRELERALTATENTGVPQSAAENRSGLEKSDTGIIESSLEAPARTVQLNLSTALKKAVGCHQAGKLDQAEVIYRKILEAAPAHPDALHLLGVAAYQRKDGRTAVGLIQKAIDQAPGMPVFHSNLGAAFQLLGQLEDALAAYEKALTLNSRHVEAWFNGGNLYKILGDLQTAHRFFSRALDLRPGYAEAMNGLGMVCRKMGNEAQARQWFEQAVDQKPQFAEARYNLATSIGIPLEEAIEGLRATLEADPGHPKAYAGLVHRLYHVCDWKEVEKMAPILDQITARQLENGEKTAEQPLMNLVRTADPEQNLAVARSWAAHAHRMAPHGHVEFSFDHLRKTQSTIRVGYLSNDFRNHPVGHLIQRLFGTHHRPEFEVYGYSFGRDDGSDYRKIIAEGCDHFIDVREFTHAEAARRIHQDQIHILVDLMGHTGAENRMEICALRPAPIVCTWLGFPGTTGADFIDYIITDRVVTPESHLGWYTEQPVYLPNSYQVNDHQQIISDRVFSRTDQGLPETGFVFASFNQVYKIDTRMFDLWMRLLAAVDESVLWLFTSDPLAQANVRSEAKTRGIGSERIIFADRLPKAEHLTRQRLADLCLDTRRVNGHTTTSDALWAGLPVITIEGSNFASRVAASLLNAVGLPELVTKSLGEYEALALDLAYDRDKLTKIREKLGQDRKTSPLYDTFKFVRNLEASYKEMVRKFTLGEKPSRIDVGEKAHEE